MKMNTERDVESDIIYVSEEILLLFLCKCKGTEEAFDFFLSLEMQDF